MANYLRRVAAAAARTSPPGMPAVGTPTPLPKILYPPIGRVTPESFSNGEPLPLERETETISSLILPANAAAGAAPPWAEPSSAETVSVPQPHPKADDSPILGASVNEPGSIAPRDPPGMPPLPETSGPTEQGHPEMDHAPRSISISPRPLSPSPPEPVISPGSVQAASEFRPQNAQAIDPGASRGIDPKQEESDATVVSADQPRPPGRSETRGPISRPQTRPPEPFRIQALQSNPSRVDASIFRKSAGKDSGTPKSSAPSPRVPAAVKHSPAGEHQSETSIRHTEVDPLPPSPTPPNQQVQERPGTPQLKTHPVSEAGVPRTGRSNQGVALPPLADRLNAQKNGARIAIGRIEVQVNNHPPAVATEKPIAQSAPRDIDLESRFLSRFVLRPS
jgi:hypothetical protein